MSVRTIEVALRANVAQFQAQMGAAAGQVKAFETGIGNAMTSTDAKTKQALETISKGALVIGGGLVAGFALAVGAAANFEKQMSGVGAVSGATGAEMKLLGEAALKAGADTSFSASDAARAQAELAKAGISTADILGGALTGSLALAAAGQVDLGTAAEISAQAMNIFSLEGRDVGHIADLLAAGANKSAADVGQLGDALRQGGLVAAQTGLSIEETVGTLAAFADSALVGSDAGTSLKVMLQRLTPTSAEAAGLMTQLGFSAYDASGNFIGMEALAGELQSSLGNLTAEQRNTALATLFGSDAVRGANVLYEQGAEGIKGYISAVDDQGAAQRMAAELTNNLAGDVERLGGSLETALIRGGTGANAVLRELTQVATGAVNSIGSMPTPVLAAGVALAGITGSALLVLGAVGTMVPKIHEAREALTALGPAGETANKGLGAMGRAAGVATILIGVASAAKLADSALDELADPRKATDISKLSGELATVGDTSKLSQSLVSNLGYSLSDLTGRIADVQTRGWLEDFVKGSTFADRAVRELDAGLAGLANGGAIDAAAAQFAIIEDELRGMGLSTEQITAAFPGFTQAMSDAKAAAAVQAAATGEAANSQQGLNQAMGESIPITEAQKMAVKEAEDAAEELRKVYEGLAESLAGFVSPMEAYNAVLDRGTEAARAHAEGIAASTEDAEDSWEDYATQATVSLTAFADQLQIQIDAQNEWADNLGAIARRGREDVARELAAMGPEGAALVAQFADASDAEFNRAADLFIESTRRGGVGAGQALDQELKVMAEIGRQGSQATVQSVSDALGVLPEDVSRIANEANVQLQNAEPAWNQSWTNRTQVSTAEMETLLRDAPPLVRQAADDLNRYLAEREPEFFAQMESRRGVSIDEMNTILRDAPPPLREAAELVNRHLADTAPAWNEAWGSRQRISVAEMDTLLRDAPPLVLQAADDMVRYLAERHPAFLEQMQSRRGVSVDEMNVLLRDAPPIVREAAEVMNRHLRETQPTFAESMMDRPRSAWGAVTTMRRDAPPEVGRTADEMTGALNSRHGAFSGAVIRYQDTLNGGIRAVGMAAAVGGLSGGLRQADGGIVEFYAKGGMKEAHQAQIARAGDWRVWAEPETGGEAYIPLAVAKRARSTDILEEVAGRFGLVVRSAREDEVLDYARGGFAPCRMGHQGCQHFHSGGLYVPPPHPQFNDFGPPIKPAGSGTTHNMREHVAEVARQHMNLAHHQAPPPGSGMTGGAGGGGKALDRVRAAMADNPGLRITSTYRSPSQNAAVGGARNSLHMDRANPAVDIGGPTAGLDRFHSELRGMGGWRELLWRVRGHYDHIHAADQGAIFDSIRSYDQGGFLPPGVTLAYNGTGMPERILTMAEGGLMGDTYYGDPGGYRKRERRLDDDEGAQFDYARNRRERRFYAHERLDTPSQWKQDQARPDRRRDQPAPVMTIPTSNTVDNSFRVDVGGFKIDIRAEVGANPAGMVTQIRSSVDEAISQFQAALWTEIRTRRG